MTKPERFKLNLYMLILLLTFVGIIYWLAGFTGKF
jgi:hypothetical protein